MTPDDWCTASRHGTRTAYQGGCRCTASRILETLYQRERRSNPTPRKVPATGTRRRIQALYRMGWTGQHIADRLGVAHSQISIIQRGRQVVLRSTAERMVAVYDQMSMTPGPSLITRQYAIRRGWAPPLAWDDDCIDDPAAKPDGIVKPRKRIVLHLDDIEELALAGVPWSVAVTRLGAPRTSIEQHCKRADRRDLMRRFSVNSQGEYALAERRNGWSA